MNAWLVAAISLAFGYIPCGIVVTRARVLDRLVASQMAGLLTVLELEMFAQAFSEAFYMDLALAVALLSLPAGIAFAYFYARWL